MKRTCEAAPEDGDGVGRGGRGMWREQQQQNLYTYLDSEHIFCLILSMAHIM